MQYFIDKDSVVRRIWGKADTVLFIFAGAAAEFALNKAVDWLYFTGKLPADPLGRLFSTVTYARQIIFAPQEEAFKAIDQINKIHRSVEEARGAQIPDWAYRDVLYMLIDYSVRSFELLERNLTAEEKNQVFDAFYKVGRRMGIPGLPANYAAWLVGRAQHLENNMVNSKFTIHLFEQYKKHLGAVRYALLKQVWLLLTPAAVRQLLPFKDRAVVKPVIGLYKLSRLISIDKLVKEALLPGEYKARIKALDIA
ncbi:DUF2236 domain-containing protein [Mucilaginibacter pallidiroseus]|uniref:DUF2236 domain-containing protein n=1 Tax=Mucilaginibacter pallidiroseus TaxID=2599295 RepID=A0A563U8F3_9SPHI|nr:oxygenase MpaB family protein [Mucilaginibacter pallidiroseus]TWR27606.1 DUF2236 domain-containing protein [Mucilaginibacter pallidiroseus]